MATELPKSHRLFLQSIMARPFMSERDVKDAYSKCMQSFQEDDDLANFETCVNTVNAALQPLFLEIRKGVSEDDGKQYYGLVNSSEDQISKLATNCTPHAMEYFRKLLDMFVQSDDGTATSVELLHCAADLPKSMSASQAEKLLDTWIKEKWLSESSGDIWLGPRAVLELQPYLKRVYEEFIVDCSICMDVVLRGQGCPACDVKLHHHCASRYFQGREVMKCPGCTVDWPHNVQNNQIQAEEEDAERNSRAETQPTQQPSTARTREPRRRGRR